MFRRTVTPSSFNQVFSLIPALPDIPFATFRTAASKAAPAQYTYSPSLILPLYSPAFARQTSHGSRVPDPTRPLFSRLRSVLSPARRPSHLLTPLFCAIALAQDSSASASDYTIQTSPPEPTSATSSETSSAASSSSDANSSTTATTTSVDPASTSAFPGTCSSDCQVIADALSVRFNPKATTRPISSATEKSSETDIVGAAVHHHSSTVLRRWHNTQYDMFVYRRRGAELPVMFTMRTRYGSYYR